MNPQIMIIDDQNFFHNAIKRVNDLSIKADIHSAYTALDGIAKLNELSIDIILMDVHMPGMTGFEAAKEIRNNERTKDIPIIFITADEQNHELNQLALEYGGIDFINKSKLGTDLERQLKLYLRFLKRENELLFEMQLALDTKDRFFSILAHDLKSPFSGFLGFLNILKNDLMKMPIEQIIDIVGDIHKSANLLYELLENLLDWSRIQRGTMPFNPVNIKLNTIVIDIFSLAQLNADKKHVKLINNLQNDIYVKADAKMLMTILRNLVMNSIKFVNDGGQVAIGAYDNGKGYINIAVIDNGVGMSKEVQEKIFAVDQNYTSPGTSGEQGTGLGVVLCNELTKRHGGKMTVESEEGKGTKFSFTIPVGKAEEQRYSEINEI